MRPFMQYASDQQVWTWAQWGRIFSSSYHFVMPANSSPLSPGHLMKRDDAPINVSTVMSQYSMRGNLAVIPANVST